MPFVGGFADVAARVAVRTRLRKMRTGSATTRIMNDDQQRAILGIAILAAFADDRKADSEREEVRRVAQTLGGASDMQTVLRDVLLGQLTVASASALLPDPALRRLAYELAVGVCEADGLRNDHETRFLAELAATLGLGGRAATAPIETGDALATLPLETEVSVPLRSGPEIDAMILNYAILNGALELLPQSTASMAIIPMQMKMVYRIGKEHGYALDRGHVRDLLAAMGVGLTGQYLEEIGRKLVGGLFGKVAGRMLGGVARGATGMAFSFATTWALGQVARRYYAGGRVMSAQMLKDTYAQTLAQAKTLHTRYLPQIEQKARTIDVGQIVRMARSQ